MMFYQFNQNNSHGGYKFPGQLTIDNYIEADSIEEAVKIGEGLGMYFDPSRDCACCGPRWTKPYDPEENIDESLMYSQHYGSPREDGEPSIRVFYKSGAVFDLELQNYPELDEESY